MQFPFLLALLLLLLLLLASCSAQRQESNNPVILVPGDGGNELWANLTKTNNRWYCRTDSHNSPVLLWLQLTSLFYPSVNCLIYNLMLKPSPNGSGTLDNDGVKTFVRDFGSVDSMLWLGDLHTSKTNYFAGLVDYLTEQHSLKQDVTIRGAPYDFRRAPDEQKPLFTGLKRLIEESFDRSGGRRSVLVAHSMGSMFVLHFLQRQPQAWKNKFISKFVPVAAPFGGVPITLGALLAGYNLRMPLVNPRQFRPVQRSWPSVKYLLPRSHLHPAGTPLLTLGADNYSVSDIDTVLQLAGFAAAERRESDRLLALTDPLRAPGVPTLCVFGSGSDTPARLSWPTGRRMTEEQPLYEFGDGDGTVEAATAGVCRGWRRQQAMSVEVSVLSGAGHVDILQEPRFLAEIGRAVIAP